MQCYPKIVKDMSEKPGEIQMKPGSQLIMMCQC